MINLNVTLPSVQHFRGRCICSSTQIIYSRTWGPDLPCLNLKSTSAWRSVSRRMCSCCSPLSSKVCLDPYARRSSTSSLETSKRSLRLNGSTRDPTPKSESTKKRTGSNVPRRSFLGDSHFIGRRQVGMLTAQSFSSSYGAGGLNSESIDSGQPDDHMEPIDSDSTTELSPEPRKLKGSLQAVGILVAILSFGTLAALALTLNSGGPAALLSIVSKSGFPAAFALIFISEIGDKTFFIAALLAMRHSKWLVLLGASGALAVMTGISVIIGKLFQKVPAQLQTTLPVGEYAAVALLIWFGLRSIKSAWDIPSASADVQTELGESGELAEAQEFLKQADVKKVGTPLEVLGEAFSLIFVAEWGDRSMLATIALGAAQSPWGVASGAIAGHVLATLLAVIGGSLLARHLSEKLIRYFGGVLFLVFAAATLAGVF